MSNPFNQNDDMPELPAHHPLNKMKSGGNTNLPPNFDKMPEMMKKAIQERQGIPPAQEQQSNFAKPNNSTSFRQGISRPPKEDLGGSGKLTALLEQLATDVNSYDEIVLPSKGRFYDPSMGIVEGVLHVRTMTGQEEQILTTQRYAKDGVSFNMIFKNCTKEQIDGQKLLSIDRNYLLIYLRGLSFGNVCSCEIGCQHCGKKFATDVDLNDIEVTYCPDDFGPELKDKLPKTGWEFTYKLSTGRDEVEFSNHRESKVNQFGGKTADDNTIFRLTQLITEIEGVTSKTELGVLIRRLNVMDVNYIRNVVEDPPFGLETKFDFECPHCFTSFTSDLPIDSRFFFPKIKKGTTNIG